MSEEKKDVPSYIVDQNGSISPEVRRITEVYGLVRGILMHSAGIGDGLVGLRMIAHDLAKDTDYAFRSEAAAREELIRISGFIEKLNKRVWSVTRMLGTEAETLAGRMQAGEDGQFQAELDKFLKTESVG